MIALLLKQALINKIQQQAGMNSVLNQLLQFQSSNQQVTTLSFLLAMKDTN